MTISANDGLRVGLRQPTLERQDDYFSGSHIVTWVALPASLVNLVHGIHLLGRRGIVLVIAVGVGFAMTINTAHLRLGMPLGQWFGFKIGMAHETRGGIGIDRRGCLGIGFICFRRLIQEKRRAFIHYQRRRAFWFFRCLSCRFSRSHYGDLGFQWTAKKQSGGLKDNPCS